MADASMYILNPVFKAESFKEMVEPLNLYAQAYKEQEAKIEDMTDKAAALEWIANRDPESQTAALYRNMSEKIKDIRDDMMINGLQGGTRSRILGTRRIYSANSAEITRRYEDMKKYQERMEQLKDKDNSMIFSPESQNVSLDDFAGGKRPQIKAISGNEVMARGAAVGKRFTSQVFGDGVAGKAAGDQFWRIYKEQGMTDEALAKALEEIGQSDKYPLLNKIINGVYSSFEGFSDADKEELKNKFMEGFYSGAVYTKDVTYQQNVDHLTPMDKHRIAIDNAQNARAQGEYNAKMEEYNFKRGKTSRTYNGVEYRVDPTSGQVVPVNGVSNGTIVIDKNGKQVSAKTTLSLPVYKDPKYKPMVTVDVSLPGKKKNTTKKVVTKNATKDELAAVVSKVAASNGISFDEAAANYRYYKHTSNGSYAAVPLDEVNAGSQSAPSTGPQTTTTSSYTVDNSDVEDE